MNIQKQIRNHLKTLGLKSSYMPPTLSTDAQIEIIKTNYRIELGNGYICLCKITEEDEEKSHIEYVGNFIGPWRVNGLLSKLTLILKS